MSGGQTGRVVEQVLAGGFVNRVVRVGDTVRRNQGRRPEFVHLLLRHLEQRGWTGAPRFLAWDIAAPGARIHDVAHMRWQYLDLGPEVSDLTTTT